MRRIRTVVFLSNNFTYHQAALSDALWGITEGNYTFVETSEKARERQARGVYFSAKPYVLNYWENEENVRKLVKEADVVIAGSAYEPLVQVRIRTGKILFRYSERPLKKGLEIWRYPDRFLRWHRKNPFRRPIYMLCASAYTAQDYRKFGLFRNKTYKWGYFPETKKYTDLENLIVSKNTTEILWCGRFLEWKHPDDALAVAEKLKREGYRFNLKFIGTGIMEEQLKRMTKEYYLEDCVSFLGRMSPDQVREHMEKAGIYLFTSDQQEGWGAVLNESMNSGCAVIASHAIGAVPYLLEDGRNGIVYESGDVEMLCEKVKFLLERPDEQKRLGLAAYRTIAEVWNAELAANRFVKLAEQLLSGDQKTDQFASGPCSRTD